MIDSENKAPEFFFTNFSLIHACDKYIDLLFICMPAKFSFVGFIILAARIVYDIHLHE